MANINVGGEFVPFGTDLSQLILTKVRVDNSCWICKSKIPKGSYCLGRTYRWHNSKVCLSCAEQFLNNFIKSIEEFKQIGIKVLKDIEKNKTKYTEINILARI